MLTRLLNTLNWFARLPNSMAENLANQYEAQKAQSGEPIEKPVINWWFVGLIVGIGYLVVYAVLVLLQKVKNLKNKKR
jgi:hypothetical protein